MSRLLLHLCLTIGVGSAIYMVVVRTRSEKFRSNLRYTSEVFFLPKEVDHLYLWFKPL